MWKYFSFFLLIFFLNIYFWDRERQSMSRGGSEREGDTESEAGSRLWAVSTEPDMGLEPTDRETMAWAEVRRSTDWATQAPQYVFFYLCWFIFEKVCEWRRVRERKRIRGRLHAVSIEPDMVLKLMNHELMTWGKVRCSINWATQAPQYFLYGF